MKINEGKDSSVGTESWSSAFVEGLHKAVALNLWVVTLLGVSNIPFTGFEYQTSCISDICITIHNNNKITVIK